MKKLGGEYTTEEQERKRAQWFFLSQVEKHSPEVLQELHDRLPIYKKTYGKSQEVKEAEKWLRSHFDEDVDPAEEAPRRAIVNAYRDESERPPLFENTPDDVREALIEWGARFNLNDDWLMKAAINTLHRWMVEPVLIMNTRLMWQLAEVAERDWPLEIPEHDSIISIRWYPELETRKSVTDRFTQELDRIEQLCVDRGMRRSKGKYEDSYHVGESYATVTGTAYRHFDWLVHFQVQGRGWTSIAKQYGTTKQNVMARATETAELIKLTLRTTLQGCCRVAVLGCLA